MVGKAQIWAFTAANHITNPTRTEMMTKTTGLLPPVRVQGIEMIGRVLEVVDLEVREVLVLVPVPVRAQAREA